MKLVDYADLKAFAVARQLSVQYVDLTAAKAYWLAVADGQLMLECTLDKVNQAADVADFEANLKPGGNKKIVPSDTDGSVLQRPKYAPPGWTYQLRSLEFETSLLGSARSKKVAPGTKVETDWGDVTLKFFNAAGTELTDQTTIDTDAVWTQVDFEPTYDIEIVGGAVRLLTELTTDVYMTLIGVPDIPTAYGGTKYFVSDINLNYIPAQGVINADGRTSKKLTYDATYHTNKMRALFRHAAGVKHRIQINYEFYRS